MVASAKPVRAVLFDAGGTLFADESVVTTITAVMQRVTELNGEPPLSAERAAAWVAGFRAGMGARMSAVLKDDFYLFDPLGTAATEAAAIAAGLTWRPEWRTETRDVAHRCIEAAAVFLPGAAEALEALAADGFTVGVVTNADQVHAEIVDRALGLSSRCRFVLSSEAAQSCKPHGRIFAQALALAGCGADEAMYVGDSIPWDVVGANRAGLRSVLTTQAALKFDITDELGADGRPDHVVGRLDELLPLVR